MNGTSLSSLPAALADWRMCIGEQRVCAGASAQQTYGICTTGISKTVPAALRPTTVQEIAPILAIARQHGIPLYPISTGHNWGYGTASPAIDDCVVLDLSGLDRVIKVDRALGLATVEPGVTQQKLFEYLEREHLPFLVPTTGAGPDCSLLGNALERGYGITPYADHFGAVTSIQAVLADGRTYTSALSELGGDVVDGAFKWGVGPYLDGLFAQGSFGIVTRMTIALAPRPDRIAAFLFTLAQDEDLEKAVAGIQEILRRLGGVVGSINLMNARRVLSMAAPYAVPPSTNRIVPADVITALAQQSGVATWTGFGALYGTPRIVKAAQGEIRRVLKPVASSLRFLTPSLASSLSRILNTVPWLRTRALATKARTLEASLQLVAGKPSQVALPLAYLRSSKRPDPTASLDPARDGCGLIWYPPLVPMIPERVRRYSEMVERICAAHAIEPLITLTSLSDRCFDSSVPLLFDRSDPDATDRAHNCYRNLLEAGKNEGFLPYRLGVQGMERLVSPDSAFWQIASQLKFALDPTGIIAPGRYCLPTRLRQAQ